MVKETKTEESAVAVVEEETETPTPKKKRGRPAGSKNKTTKATAEAAPKKKRGRPAGSKNTKTKTAKKADERKKPGRKAGFKMKRDKKGRLLKSDGTLAKSPGRKPKGMSAKDLKALDCTVIINQVREIRKKRNSLLKIAQSSLQKACKELVTKNGSATKRESNRMVKNINQLTEAISSM